MYRKQFVCTLLACLLFYGLQAQDTLRKVYIYSPKQADGSLIKIKLEVNGRRLELRRNTFAELEVPGDSIVIRILNRHPVTKNGEEVRMPASGEQYFMAFINRVSLTRQEFQLA